MDRDILYPGQIPLVENSLQAQRNAVVAIGHTLGAGWGYNQITANGFTIAEGAGLSFVISPGSLNYPAQVDLTNYSVLTADTSAIVQQAICETSTQITVTADGNPYVIAVNAVTADDTPVVLPFYNAANPAQTLAGQSNNGMPLPTRRPVIANVGLYAFGAVPNGCQPLYDVTVPVGSASAAISMVTTDAAAPFFDTIPELEARIAALETILDFVGVTIEGDTTNLVAGQWFAPYTGNFKVIAVAAGGSGGSASSSNVGGGGGGGGAYFEFVVAMNIGDSLSYNMPPPGQRSSGNNQTGQSASALVVTVGGFVATGGGGGNGGISTASGATSPGGIGGDTAFTGTTNNVSQGVGNSGGDGGDGAMSNQPGGNGGDSNFGGGGRASTASPRNGRGWGSGGGGAYIVIGGNAGNSISGAGAPGKLTIQRA